MDFGAHDFILLASPPCFQIQAACQSVAERARSACRWHERCSLSSGLSPPVCSYDRTGRSKTEVARVPLIKNKYGKGRVRVMRIHRDGERHEVSELNIQAMLEGDFARTYTHADNSNSVSTDTVKNIVNIVARENTGLGTEEFCQVLAQKYLDLYPQVASVAVTAHETKWSRLSFGGKPHPHSFILDSNGKPFVEVSATRQGSSLLSGINGFAFMKSTQSGWENYVKDRYTTIKETNDRLCATSMVASWKWSGKP